MENLIYGRNSVREALLSGRKISKILISKNAINIDDILKIAKKKFVIVEFVEQDIIYKYHKKAQGVVAFCSLIKFVDVLDILNFARAKQKAPFILICYRIQDPRNLGALLRTACAVGVDGVIISKRRSSPITATVEKASAGTINFLNIAIVSNLAFAIKQLKKEGVFIYSADGSGKNFYDVNFKGAVGLVVGCESCGVSHLIKKLSDEICKVPMKDYVDSLHVSVAAGVLMYEFLRQNEFKS